MEDLPSISLHASWKHNATTIMDGVDDGPTKIRLSYPKGIWICHDHSVLIADFTNHRIVKCDANMKKTKIAGTDVFGHAREESNFPTDIVFQESTNSFFICDYKNRRVVQWFLGPPQSVKVILTSIACYGIAIDSVGNLYVSDKEKHEVRRYAPVGAGDRRGAIVAGGNGRGSSLHQLNGPTYICIGPEETLYISDSGNDRVVKHNLNTKQSICVAGGNGRGTEASQLNNPSGLVVDQYGTLYVADQMNNRVMRWYKDKNKGERIIGEDIQGDSPSHLNGPEGIRFDRRGNLYVVDGYNHRIQKFQIVRARATTE